MSRGHADSCWALFANRPGLAVGRWLVLSPAPPLDGPLTPGDHHGDLQAYGREGCVRRGACGSRNLRRPPLPPFAVPVVHLWLLLTRGYPTLPQDFIKAYAAHLKSNDKVQQPSRPATSMHGQPGARSGGQRSYGGRRAPMRRGGIRLAMQPPRSRPTPDCRPGRPAERRFTCPPGWTSSRPARSSSSRPTTRTGTTCALVSSSGRNSDREGQRWSGERAGHAGRRPQAAAAADPVGVAAEEDSTGTAGEGAADVGAIRPAGDGGHRRLGGSQISRGVSLCARMDGPACTWAGAAPAAASPGGSTQAWLRPTKGYRARAGRGALQRPGCMCAHAARIMLTEPPAPHCTRSRSGAPPVHPPRLRCRLVHHRLRRAEPPAGRGPRAPRPGGG